MFPVSSYYNNHRTWPCFVFLFLFCLPLFPAMFLPDSMPELKAEGLSNSSWHGFMRFLDAGKGGCIDGMAELKRYFGRFGYMPFSSRDHNFTDFFDEEFESALVSYQKNLGLSETGKLDYDTMRVIVSPRCGVSDVVPAAGGRFRTTRHFAYFEGEPRWARPTPMTLTYAFSPAHMIDYVNSTDVKLAFRSAFSRWSAVIPVNFTEARSYSSANIKIGWYSGDHGDGEEFDGVLGVLAHAFSPENGRFHLDSAERWAVDFSAEKSKVAVDLESVATHEIGHLLGLGHSSVKEAIMYPSLSPRKKKVELREDDVEGIQALYGSNPNYRLIHHKNRKCRRNYSVVYCTVRLSFGEDGFKMLPYFQQSFHFQPEIRHFEAKSKSKHDVVFKNTLCILTPSPFLCFQSWVYRFQGDFACRLQQRVSSFEWVNYILS